jgi:hypothetical protein
MPQVKKAILRYLESKNYPVERVFVHEPFHSVAIGAAYDAIARMMSRGRIGPAFSYVYGFSRSCDSQIYNLIVADTLSGGNNHSEVLSDKCFSIISNQKDTLKIYRTKIEKSKCYERMTSDIDSGVVLEEIELSELGKDEDSGLFGRLHNLSRTAFDYSFGNDVSNGKQFTMPKTQKIVERMWDYTVGSDLGDVGKTRIRLGFELRNDILIVNIYT